MILKPKKKRTAAKLGDMRTVTRWVAFPTDLDDGHRVCLEFVLCDQELKEVREEYWDGTHRRTLWRWITYRRYRIPKPARARDDGSGRGVRIDRAGFPDYPPKGPSSMGGCC